MFEGQEIIPLQSLNALLPEPASFGSVTRGKTNFGVFAAGEKNGVRKTFYLNNVCDHESAHAETGSQAVSYTNGVPTMSDAALVLSGQWSGAGVFNMEQLEPDPVMEMLNRHGLPWQVRELASPLAF